MESKKSIFLLATAISCVVILGSIGLVRLGNRARSASPGVLLSTERIQSLPDSAIARSFPIEAFATARQRFVATLESGDIDADSTRRFYQSYAQWMRDGSWDSTEIVQLGVAMGLTAP